MVLRQELTAPHRSRHRVHFRRCHSDHQNQNLQGTKMSPNVRANRGDTNATAGCYEARFTTTPRKYPVLQDTHLMGTVFHQVMWIRCPCGATQRAAATPPAAFHRNRNRQPRTPRSPANRTAQGSHPPTAVRHALRPPWSSGAAARQPWEREQGSEVGAAGRESQPQNRRRLKAERSTTERHTCPPKLPAMAKRKKGMSLEEKRTAMLGIFHEMVRMRWMAGAWGGRAGSTQRWGSVVMPRVGLRRRVPRRKKPLR